MKLRMLSTVVKFAVAVAIVAGVAASASAQSTPAPAGASSGGFKIAVVDRKKVFDDYGKRKSQWDALSQKKTKIENDLNTKFDALKKKKDDFDTKKAGMSEVELSKQENTLNKELADLKIQAQANQKELNDEGERIIKGIRQEIDSAVRAIGQSGNYHLILEADMAFSSVIYFSDTMDITPQVLEYVSAHSNDAPAAAPAPAPANSGTKKGK